MPLPKLNLTIPEDGYSVEDGESVLTARLSGGPSRHRLDMLGAPQMVEISLVLEPGAFEYWRAFYRTEIAEGALPFLVDLMIDQASMVEHQVKIVPGSSRLSAKRGSTYLVQFRCEAKPVPRDVLYDASLVDIYEIYGDEAALMINLLEHLVLIDLPEGLE